MPRITRASLSKSPAAERKKGTTPKGGKTQTPKKDAVPAAKKGATPAKSPARSASESRSISKGRQLTPVSSSSATRSTSKRKSSEITPAKGVQKESTPAKKGRIASPSPVPKSRPTSRGRSVTKVEPAKSNKKSTTPAKKSTTPAKKTTSPKKPTPAKSRSQSRQKGQGRTANSNECDTPKGKGKTEAAKKEPAKSQSKSRERSQSKGKTVVSKQKAAPVKKTPQKSASKTTTPKATTPKSETKTSTSKRSTSRGQGNDAVQGSESMPSVSVVVEKMDSRKEAKPSPKEEVSSEEKRDSEVKCTLAETTKDTAEKMEEGPVKEGAQAKEEVKETIEEVEAKEEPPVKGKISEKVEGQHVPEVDGKEKVEAEIEQEEKLEKAEVEMLEEAEVEKDKDDEAEVDEVQKEEELDVEKEKDEAEVEEVEEATEEFEAKKMEDQQIAKGKATVPAVQEEPDKAEAQVEKEVTEVESPLIVEDENTDVVVEEPSEAVEVSDEAQEIEDEDVEEILEDDICVQEIPTEVIDDEVTTVTDVEMVEEISAVEETAPFGADIPASAISEVNTNEQPNGGTSEPALVSPRRKRKWEELGEDADESLSPKKLRVSMDAEETVPKEVINQQNGEQPSAEEKVVSSEEPIEKDFEIVDMSNIPTSDSQEVLDSLPKTHTLTTDQAAMNINQSVSNDDQSQSLIDAPHSSQVETLDPVLNRVFVPSPNFQSENANPEKQFSLVSYNVLADCHLTRNDYSFTDPKYLKPEQRLSRLLDELLYLDGDIICLQEVSPEFYNDKLYPRLNLIGYDGFFQKRTNDFYHEGEATFYRTSRFTHIASQKYGLKDLNVAEIPEGTDQDLRAAIEKYIDSSDVLIVTRLKCCKTGQEVTVGNIHVIWGEMKVPDVQCIQICSAVKTVVNMAVGEANPHIICGDFNSEPSSSGYQLLKEGYIGDEAIQTLQNIDGIILPDGSRQALVNKLWQAFQHTSSSLKSAYLIAQGEEPKISSYNKVMCACVDYIFYSSSSLDNVGVYKLADPEKIRETGGTPNQFFPSDHVSLKAVLSFK
ncbi:hypothetical protein CHS0354_021673 [Potamilus streckersoni]|uniref:Endonuclease/exonuclease/phosphatase domain-containing protein n=1 Tax=Potamilus streckersoni TaxID=2493646 RepID=A0AAE0SIH0_9BIVA|nr:hypothetical protein CHS0354_021673 [Potamilus streckersoni]